jgi:hypothetical protein
VAAGKVLASPSYRTDGVVGGAFSINAFQQYLTGLEAEVRRQCGAARRDPLSPVVSRTTTVAESTLGRGIVSLLSTPARPSRSC